MDEQIKENQRKWDEVNKKIKKISNILIDFNIDFKKELWSLKKCTVRNVITQE